MTDDTSGDVPSDLTPDFECLYDAAKELGEEMVLEFVGRVGSTPYARWTADGWDALSVGPWDSTDDGRAIISAKEIEVDDEYVRELIDDGPVVQLVWYTNTPFDGYEPWEYGGLNGEDNE